MAVVVDLVALVVFVIMLVIAIAWMMTIVMLISSRSTRIRICKHSDRRRKYKYGSVRHRNRARDRARDSGRYCGRMGLRHRPSHGRGHCKHIRNRNEGLNRNRSSKRNSNSDSNRDRDSDGRIGCNRASLEPESDAESGNNKQEQQEQA